MTEVTGPNRPEPKNVSLDAAKTAVVVLDLNARCHEPEEVCHRLSGAAGRVPWSGSGMPPSLSCSPSRCSSGARPSARRRRPSSAGTPSPCYIPTPSTNSPAASSRLSWVPPAPRTSSS